MLDVGEATSGVLCFELYTEKGCGAPTRMTPPAIALSMQAFLCALDERSPWGRGEHASSAAKRMRLWRIVAPCGLVTASWSTDGSTPTSTESLPTASPRQDNFVVSVEENASAPASPAVLGEESGWVLPEPLLRVSFKSGELKVGEKAQPSCSLVPSGSQGVTK